VEERIRRFEKKLGIDRHGRTVWVWLIPPGIGLCAAVLFGVVATLSSLAGDIGVGERILVAVFGFITMTVLTGICLAWFGDSEE
jgi:flagellar motor component MotA